MREGLQEALRKEKEMNQQHETHLQQLAQENADLQKKVTQLSNKNPEDFYREYVLWSFALPHYSFLQYSLVTSLRWQ